MLASVVPLLCAMAIAPPLRPATPALPALRLGGEWAGHSIAYSAESGAIVSPGVEALSCETWNKDRALERRTVQLQSDGAVVASRAVLPVACSDSLVLALGASMLEPETLNARAWVLDAVDESTTPGMWQCEAVFDGLCGDRPASRDDAWECPKERTRVQCSFDPATGALAPSSEVLVWHERCWSVPPKGDLDERETDGALDLSWVSAVVGLDSFAAAAPSPPGTGGGATDLTLGCGIRLRGEPGLLEVTLTSGVGARNGYDSIVAKRTWAGGSKFAEITVNEDRTGDD